jgi:hypothetical protein
LLTSILLFKDLGCEFITKFVANVCSQDKAIWKIRGCFYKGEKLDYKLFVVATILLLVVLLLVELAA